MLMDHPLFSVDLIRWQTIAIAVEIGGNCLQKGQTSDDKKAPALPVGTPKPGFGSFESDKTLNHMVWSVSCFADWSVDTLVCGVKEQFRL